MKLGRQELIARHMFCNHDFIKKLLAIQTPAALLTDFHPPEATMILPDRFSTFESLLEARDEIRHLKTLPVKDNEQRAHYHNIKDTLHDSVKEIFGIDCVAIADNAYPYFLPPDVDQKIIWVKEGTAESEVTAFLIDYIREFNISLDHSIMFERPRHTTVPLVRGSFPYVRHIHLWTKKADTTKPLEPNQAASTI